MDQPFEFAPPPPWRTAALVATAVAAVELFILLLVGFVYGAKTFSDKTTTATVAAIKREVPAATSEVGKDAKPAQPAKHEPSGPLPRGKTSVVVLNGNGIPGAAAVSADRAHELHYIVTATGNAPRTDFSRSLVMFRPGFKPAATRLAKDMGVKRVTPLDGIQKSDLQGAQLALIIGG
ncbi:MAG TPA: LytR C-terminal domain-containing protein [Gaiellaceae bacterium]|nr:LytR C-terminal domain-containing protein [Gaiellaceae bacterium]